ncbi:MAG: hypothetical protein P4L93_04455 [Coriobacteriia bacterium]|nr:hypothetical protein [Coriobacteriia bacterium]
MRFPTLETQDLEGATTRVPDDLPGNPRVIILAFQRWHQMLVDGWSRHAHALAQTYPEISVWEVPAMSHVYAVGRFFIDGGMKAAIPDLAVRQHTLTAYTDLTALITALEIPDYETVHVYLLDSAGEIVWRGSGQVDEDQAAALAAAAEKLMTAN